MTFIAKEKSKGKKRIQTVHGLLKSMDEKIEKSKQPDIKTEEETKEKVEKAFEKKAWAVL